MKRQPKPTRAELALSIAECLGLIQALRGKRKLHASQGDIMIRATAAYVASGRKL